MALPTDGNEHGDHPDHPDLIGVAAELRAEWRAEQEAAAADAVAYWRHDRALTSWLRDRMHAGDRVEVRVVGRSFAGLVEEVGDDLCAVRGGSGRVDVHLGAGIPIAFELVERAHRGGARSMSRRRFRDALLARDGQLGVRVGTLAEPAGVEGAVFVGRDFVSIVTRAGTETAVPIAQIAWVAVARD